MPPASSYYAQKLETMPRKELEALQFKKLKYLLDYAYHKIPFYTNLCDRYHLRPEDINNLQEYYEKWPVITKKDLIVDQEENPPWGTRSAIPLDKIAQSHITSGTSGTGQEVYTQTAVDVEYSGSCWASHLYWAGVRKGDIFANLLPIGTMAATLSVMQGMMQLGVNPFHIAIFDTKSKLDYMKKFPPHYIWTVPAYLTRLTVLCDELGIDPRKQFPGLKGITVATEAFPIEWAERMEEFWGCTIQEIYGSTQMGSIMGGTCEAGVLPNHQRGSIHLFEYYSLVEIRDVETGERVRSGEAGEAWITTLVREAAPLIRYRTGDKVTYISHQECDCGRTLDSFESGTVVRLDDMMKIKAANIWPQTIDEVIFGKDQLEEYNGRIFIDEKGREQVEIIVEFKQKGVLTAEEKIYLLKQVGEEIRARTQVSMLLKEVPYNTIPRFDFKVRRWTDERQTGLKQVKFTAK